MRRRDINKTFSKEGITFEYPGDWFEVPAGADKLLNGYAHEIGVLIPPINYGNVIIQKYNLQYLGVNSVQEDWSKTIDWMKKDNITIIMQNTTTVNGLTIYKMINSGYEPAYNGTQKMLYVEVGKDQNVYIIQLYSESSSFDSYLSVFNQVVSTIKIK